MNAAAWIVGLLSRITPLLLRALEHRWDATRLRAELGSLINDDELRQAQATARDVENYLKGG